MRFWFRRDKAGEPERKASAPSVAAPVATVEAAAPQLAPAIAVDEERAEEERKQGFFKKIALGLQKTKAFLDTPVEDLFRKTAKVSTETIASLEEILLAADIGPETTAAIIDAAKRRLKKGDLDTADKLNALVRQEILETLRRAEAERKERPGGDPRVVIIVGVNGNGKTTTIGKLAKAYRSEGAKVLIAAADTFRAAAIEQLKVWGERAGAPVVARESGSDPAAVVFDAIRECRRSGHDYLIVDTAGRLQTKQPLMAELQKIGKVIGREVPGGPHEALLVIDATTGQNGVAQAREFARAVPISGIVLTKLDGTAKGGIVVAVAREFRIPIRYVGVGEKLDDLVPFSAETFVDSLFPA